MSNETNETNASFPKVGINYTKLLVAICVLLCILIVLVVLPKLTGRDASEHANTSLLTTNSEWSLSSTIKSTFGENTSIVSVPDSHLYLVDMAELSASNDLFFLDRKGRYLIRGEAFDLELSAKANASLRELLASGNQAVDGELSDFLAGTSQPNEVGGIEITQAARKPIVHDLNPTKVATIQSAQVSPAPAEITQPQIVKPTRLEPPAQEVKPNRVTAVTDTASSKVAENHDSQNKSRLSAADFKLPLGTEDSIDISQRTLNLARELKLNDPSIVDKCMTISLEADTFAELIYLYGQFQSTDVRFKCGDIYNGHLLPLLSDDDLIVFKAPNERGHVTIVSDFTCPFCVKQHKELDQFLDAGITVRIWPYGRHPYNHGDSPTPIALNKTLAMCEPIENRPVIFDELVKNKAKYQRSIIPQEMLQGERAFECQKLTYIYKMMGDVTAGETPIIISSKGHVNRGYEPTQNLLAKWF